MKKEKQQVTAFKNSAVAEGGPGGALDPPEFFRTDIVKLTILVF